MCLVDTSQHCSTLFRAGRADFDGSSSRGALLKRTIRFMEIFLLQERFLMASLLSDKIPRAYSLKTCFLLTLPCGCITVQHPLVQGGLILMAVAGANALLKRVLDVLWEACRRQCVVRIQMDSRDDVYRWLMHWLSIHGNVANSRNLSVSTSLLAFGASTPGTLATESGVSPCDEVKYVAAGFLF